LITAVGFAVVAKENVDESIHHIQVFGVAYMLVSGIGFMGMNIQIGEPWSYTLYLNLLNYLQFGFGILLSIFGSILKKRRHLILA
jgi:heme/copper-type cytochrome/quinol oxidase subunit 4